MEFRTAPLHGDTVVDVAGRWPNPADLTFDLQATPGASDDLRLEIRGTACGILVLMPYHEVLRLPRLEPGNRSLDLVLVFEDCGVGPDTVHECGSYPIVVPEPIPTLGTVALVALAVLTFAGGVWLLRA